MAKTRQSQPSNSARARGEKAAAAEVPKKTGHKRKQVSPTAEEYQELLAQLNRAKQEKDELAKENHSLKSTKRRKTGTDSIANIPVQFEEEVGDMVVQQIWPQTKFIADEEELTDVCKILMAKMKQFSDFLKDPEVEEENIRAFSKIYSSKINKTINGKRTNTAGSLRKECIARYLSGLKMPSIPELQTVIVRKDMVLLPEPKIPVVPDDATAEVAEQIQAEITEIQAEITEIQAKNAKIKQNQEWFQWHWEKLLPAVVGKHNWGHNTRLYTTISKGVFPGTNTKCITSSDEALVLILMENGVRRFAYAAKCKENGVDEDKTTDECRAKWSDSQVGQSKFGGWSLAGRQRYRSHRQVISSIKRKKTDRVHPAEKACLAALRVKHKIDAKRTKKTGQIVPDFVGKKEAKASFINLDSDDEESIGSDMEDLDDVFQAPRKKNPPARKG